MRKAAIPLNIPVLLKHVTMAVRSKGFPFEEAFLIARATLVRQGHLKPGSEEGAIIAIGLTGKGQLQNSRHLIERGGGSSKQFDDNYKRFIEKRLQKEAARQLSMNFTEDVADQAQERAELSLGNRAIDPVTPADRAAGMEPDPRPISKVTKSKKSRPSSHPVVLGTKASRSKEQLPAVPRRGRIK